MTDTPTSTNAAELRYQPVPGVLAQRVHDDLVLLDLEGGEYYGLNLVGARAWQLLSSGATLPSLVDALLQEFDVERERLEADMAALVEALTAKRLLRQAD